MPFDLVETSESKQAVDVVSREFCEHRMTVEDPARFGCRLGATRLGDVKVGTLRYGSAVTLEPGTNGQFFLVQVHLTGSATVRSGRTTIRSDPSTASVLSPGPYLSMRWAEGNEQAYFHVEIDAMRHELARLLRAEPRGSLLFDPGFDLTTPAGRSWTASLTALLQVVEEAARTDDPRLLAGWDRPLLSQLLLQAPHSHSAALARGARAGADLVDRAKELIAAHYAEPLTLGDIAEALDTSVRALQAGFARTHGAPPMAFLRERRLVQARLLLADPADARSVTEVALACGFRHLGRFAASYRAAYGEAPSRTRRAVDASSPSVSSIRADTSRREPRSRPR